MNERKKKSDEEVEGQDQPPPSNGSSENNKRRGVDHNYHDYANIRGEDAAYMLPSSNNNNTLPAVMRQHNPLACGIQQQGFAVKLHYMLSEIEATGKSSIVSWQPHGRCFVVHDRKAFVERILPSYFLQSTFASFQRQLNLYGFKRISSSQDKGGYYHELFLRGKPELACYIQRIKRKGSGPRKPDSPDSEPNFYAMDFLPNRQPTRNLFVGSCFQDPMVNAATNNGSAIRQEAAKPPSAFQVLTLKGMLPVAMLPPGGGDSASFFSSPPAPPSANNNNHHQNGGGHYGGGTGANGTLPPPRSGGLPAIVPRPQPMYPPAPAPAPVAAAVNHAVPVAAADTSSAHQLHHAPAGPGSYNYFYRQWDNIAPTHSKAPAATVAATSTRPAPSDRVSETIVHYQTTGAGGVTHSTIPAVAGSSGAKLLSGTIVHYEYQTRGDGVESSGVAVAPVPPVPPSRPRSGSCGGVQSSRIQGIAAAAVAGGSVASYATDGRRSSGRSSVVTSSSSNTSNGYNKTLSVIGRSSFDHGSPDTTDSSYDGRASRNCKAPIRSRTGETGANNSSNARGVAKSSGAFTAPHANPVVYNEGGTVASCSNATRANNNVDCPGISSGRTTYNGPRPSATSQDQNFGSPTGWTDSSTGDHGYTNRDSIPSTSPRSSAPRTAKPGAFSAYDQSMVVAGSYGAHANGVTDGQGTTQGPMIDSAAQSSAISCDQRTAENSFGYQQPRGRSNSENVYSGGRPMPLKPSVFSPEAFSNKSGSAQSTLVSVQQQQDAANHTVIADWGAFVPLQRCDLQSNDDSNPPPDMPTWSRNGSRSLSPASWNNAFGEEEDFWCKLA